MAYRVEFSNAAAKAFKKMPTPVQRRFAKLVKKLEENPRVNGAIKLTDINAYRIRTGDYRMLYEIHDGKLLVLVLKVADRKEAYKKAG